MFQKAPDRATFKAWVGGAYLAKSDSAKSETAVQERAKPYFAKPVI